MNECKTLEDGRGWGIREVKIEEWERVQMSFQVLGLPVSEAYLSLSWLKFGC